MKHVLAIDQGTTGSTCLVIGEDGRIAGRGYREITQFYPEPGLVEHDPAEILTSTVAAAREAVRQSGVAPDAIGITNQRETVVMWDAKTGRPLGRAIVWQDRRTADRCAELSGESERIAAMTGLVVDAYFSATKLEWMLRDTSLAKRAAGGELRAGTIDTWLIWNLTGGAVHATEPTNASRTMLFDINSLSWSDELCRLFGVPPVMLPEVRPSSGDFGTALRSFFGVEIPITGVAGDQQAALFGQGCWTAGEAKNTYGTGAFLLLNSGPEKPAGRGGGGGGGGLLTTVACDAAGKPVYALEAAIFIAGAAVQWLRDGLGLIAAASETEALARSVSSTDGVYFVPALVGLGAPHWEPAARGMIVGISRGTTRAHIARATLEAMAYSTADVLVVMKSHVQGSNAALERNDGAEAPPLRVDGGATANDWLMQFQADVLGITVERPHIIETTALGAAGLAGISAGIWEDARSFLTTRRYTHFTPGDGRSARREGARQWARAVRSALHWARDTQ